MEKASNETVETSTNETKFPARSEVIPSTSVQTPAGFEDFDLDDIEVIESKVFA
jgi:hypothetical protein